MLGCDAFMPRSCAEGRINATPHGPTKAQRETGATQTGAIREAVAVSRLQRRYGTSQIKKRHTEERIIASRSAGCPAARWRRKQRFGGMGMPDACKLKHLEIENSRLKRLLAEQLLVIEEANFHLCRITIILSTLRTRRQDEGARPADVRSSSRRLT